MITLMMGLGGVVGGARACCIPFRFLTVKLGFTTSLSRVGRKGRGAVIANGNQKLISERFRPIGALFFV